MACGSFAADRVRPTFTIQNSPFTIRNSRMLPCRAEGIPMLHTIIRLRVLDVRTPTSRSLAGSDAMHSDPDYSAAYVVLATDHRDGLEGHGLTFTIGRGTEICVTAVKALAPLIVGQTLEAITADMATF